MSATSELQAALVATLSAADGIVGVTSGVYDGPSARAAFPYLVIGDSLSFDWSTKDARGREHRLMVSAWDEAGRAARLHGLIGAIESAIESLPRDLPANRIASITLVRSRILRPPGGPWAGIVEYRVRTLENEGGSDGGGEG